MINLGVHETVRILVPAILLVGLLHTMFPGILPDDFARLMIAGAFLGLILSPISDRIARRWFHRQALKTQFYETLIKDFARRHKIQLQQTGETLESFSGRLSIAAGPESANILEAYKIFARQGWGSRTESYRVRTEKSFGMLYFTVAVYVLLSLGTALTVHLLGSSAYRPLTGLVWLDASLLLLVAVLCFIEATSRFRMSLSNELIVLEGHPRELRECYDSICETSRSDVHAQ